MGGGGETSHTIMVFDILIRMNTNRAEYIECPILPVVEQFPHGISGGGGEETSHTIHRVVFVLGPPWRQYLARAQAPPKNIIFTNEIPHGTH